MTKTKKSEAMEALDRFSENSIKHGIKLQQSFAGTGKRLNSELEKNKKKLEADYEIVKAALEEGYNYYATQKQVNELCEYANELKTEITRLK